MSPEASPQHRDRADVERVVESSGRARVIDLIVEPATERGALVEESGFGAFHLGFHALPIGGHARSVGTLLGEDGPEIPFWGRFAGQAGAPGFRAVRSVQILTCTVVAT